MLEEFYNVSTHSGDGRKKYVRHVKWGLLFIELYILLTKKIKKIDEQNQNILKHSSLRICVDLDYMKNANLASLLI